jgi:hypothetical protein
VPLAARFVQPRGCSGFSSCSCGEYVRRGGAGQTARLSREDKT